MGANPDRRQSFEDLCPPGTDLGPYRIIERIGAGGMGKVYKALDTRLKREVALKVLPDGAVVDAQSRTRVVQEARAASRLNHPNTITIYDIGEQDGQVFIAMELIAGRKLDELISPDGMRVDEVLKHALPIADGLAKAHAAGVIHRDLKPANIMVTTEGVVKVLDFGLAKLTQERIGNDDSTRTAQPETVVGMLMGTPGFMSPEQAQGKTTDARSDIFAFGAVLYQMATGKRAFQGESMVATLAAVLHQEPDPLPDTVPLDLQRIILRCLKKDPERRFQSMADVRVSLEELREESLGSGRSADSPIRPRSRAVPIAAAAGVILALLLGSLGLRVFRRSPESVPQAAVKFTITPKQLVRGGDIDTEVSISWDGKHIAFVESEGRQLYVRDLDSEQAHQVSGATRVFQAFWSPDGQYIGYAVGGFCEGCELVKIPVQGGTPALITKPAGAFRRASWSSDGETIVYCDTTGMYTIPGKGGAPTLILKHPHIEHPSFLDLPGGRRAILYAAVDADDEGHGIYVQVVGETLRRFVTSSTSGNPYPAFSPASSHIIYVNGSAEVGELLALPFSLKTLQPAGKAFPIAQHASTPQVSRTGTLVYSDSPTGRLQMEWMDRAGNLSSLEGEPRRQRTPVLSPDGRRVAVEVREGDSFDLWVYDLETGSKTRVTSDNAQGAPGAWTPSGHEITFASARSGTPDIFSKRTDGNGEARVLAGTPLLEQAPDWSADQRFLIYQARTPEGKSQLLYRERHSDGTLGDPVVFLQTASNETSPRFSPDGRYVAYVSDESRRSEVYVRDFPKGTSQWQISNNGGTAPRWRRDGGEIFYVQQGRRMVSAKVKNTPGFGAGAPELLFEKGVLGAGYDVSADGKRFLILDRPNDEPPLSIHVAHNWFEDFRTQQSRGK
jgi:serine/threonine protein kinase